MGAERGGDAATAAAEARGLLLAGAAAAGEAGDWWRRGRGEGPGLTERRLRGPGSRSARQPDRCGGKRGSKPRPESRGPSACILPAASGVSRAGRMRVERAG